MNETQLDIAAHHYIIAAIWADCPEGTNPRATHAAMKAAREHVRQFVTAIGADTFTALMACHVFGYGAHADCGNIEPACAAMGHDIWLTRQGHGVGFWDRKELPATLRDACTQACRKMGECYPEFYRGWLYLR